MFSWIRSLWDHVFWKFDEDVELERLYGEYLEAGGTSMPWQIRFAADTAGMKYAHLLQFMRDQQVYLSKADGNAETP